MEDTNTCPRCHGQKKIIVIDDLDCQDGYHLEQCPTCRGAGVVYDDLNPALARAEANDIGAVTV